MLALQDEEKAEKKIEDAAQEEAAAATASQRKSAPLSGKKRQFSKVLPAKVIGSVPELFLGILHTVCSQLNGINW